MNRNIRAEAQEICDTLNKCVGIIHGWKVVTFTDKYGTVHYSAKSTIQLSLGPALEFWKDIKNNPEDIAKYLSSEDIITQLLVKQIIKESA